MTPFATTIFPSLTMKELMARLSDPEEAAYAISFLKLQLARAYSADTAAKLTLACNGEFQFEQRHLDRFLVARPPIKLEADGFYQDRTGKPHGPLVESDIRSADYPFSSPQHITWTRDGRYLGEAPHPLDLIEVIF